MKFDLLKGVRVIDFTTHVAAPCCTRIMADWGADVIKVEGRGGEGYRVFGASLGVPVKDDKNPIFEAENADKRGIALDLKTPAGIEVMLKLIATADVFVTNIRMDALKRLGLDYESLSAKFPRLVWGHVSGYGLYGKEASRPGFDVVAYWARGGMLRDIPVSGSPPITAPIGVGDHTTGLALLSGICAALLKARQTGIGNKVCVSLYNTAIFANGVMIISSQYGDSYPKSRYEPATPLINSYQTKDGVWLALCILSYEKMFPRLCKILCIEELSEDCRYNSAISVKEENRTEELCKVLEAAFLKFDSRYLFEKLEEADITFERCRHFEEVSRDLQAHENHYFDTVYYSDGTSVQIPATPVQFSCGEELSGFATPAVGEHNLEILTELGYSDEQIAKMKAIGSVIIN